MNFQDSQEDLNCPQLQLGVLEENLPGLLPRNESGKAEKDLLRYSLLLIFKSNLLSDFVEHLNELQAFFKAHHITFCSSLP